MLLATLTAPLISLSGVGPATARALARLGLATVGDLLEHFPRAHEDRSRFTPLCSVLPGRPVVVQATVTAHRWFGPRGRHLRLELGAGQSGEPASAALLCFGRRFLARSLPVGTRITVAAVFERRGAALEAGTFDLQRGDDAASFGRIIPVYPLAEGVRPALLRRTMLAACTCLQGLDTPWDGYCRRRGLLPVAAAIRALHFPDDGAALRHARTSVAYAELLQLQLALHRGQAPGRAPRRFSGALSDRVVRRLPFALTGDQEAVRREIAAALRAPLPGSRLLQGEVGCGKTLVALLAAACVIEAQEQVALIVPTELLARQHARTAAGVLAPCGINVALLTGNTTPDGSRRRGAGRKALLAALRAGQIDLLVGTHALLQGDVAFARLGLVIVDEQHRFGVAQRRHLLERNPGADLLLMTATPIPRSLALTVYGDLELSLIRQLPPGRFPVRTHLARSDRLPEVLARVRRELADGGQAYFVAPRIGESPAADGSGSVPAPDGSEAPSEPTPDAVSLHATLSSEIYPEFGVGLIHGAMPEQQKHDTMEAFRSGELAVLVATTVVEVGVDVTNAVGMVVLGAERFGLATLHQLRGRVGRGPRQGYAFLVYSSSLAATGAAPAPGAEGVRRRLRDRRARLDAAGTGRAARTASGRDAGAAGGRPGARRGPGAAGATRRPQRMRRARHAARGRRGRLAGMRVTGGRYRGRRLEVPPRPVRPTTDRMREALFNVLAARGVAMDGAHFLDLFSGSGSMAVEAASRGAASVTLVERDPRKRTCLRRNTSFVSAAVRIHISPCERFLARARPAAGGGWDLAFVDPPFAYRYKPDLLAALGAGALLRDRALVVVHLPVQEGAAGRTGIRLPRPPQLRRFRGVHLRTRCPGYR